jgi:murein DD-endopeptidase MepM/ murein hydrolase activator NlpD
MGLMLLFVCSAAFCDSTLFNYPRIQQLNPKDVLFKQLQSDLQAYFQAQSREAGEEEVVFPPLQFFSFELSEGMDLFSLSARLNLPYECIATLNGLDNPAALQPGRSLLIPNQPGIFVWKPPKSTFQEIVASISMNSRENGQSIRFEKEGRVEGLWFYRGLRFTAIERAYFLNILFRFPLPFGRQTSGYGTRDNPFTGDSEFHQGIDFAAPAGTEVFAARDGAVSFVGYDEVLGRMIIIDHEAGYQTIYGHLAEIYVQLEDKIRSGTIIGAVGSTGYSTGPHLHFELRRRGAARDPAPLLPIQKEIKQ